MSRSVPHPLGGAHPSAHGGDVTGEKRASQCRAWDDVVTFRGRGVCRRATGDYEAGVRFSARCGVAFTTTHVTAAASAITAQMKATSPMSPRTVSKADLE